MSAQEYTPSEVPLGEQIAQAIEATGLVVMYASDIAQIARSFAAPAPETVDEAEQGAGADLIAAERRRQAEAEGWTPEHDAGHGDDSLVRAALSYATPERERGTKSVPRSPRASGRWGHADQVDVPAQWPWAGIFWKPSPRDRVRELVKAGALIAAEIDRLARKADL